MSESLTTNPPIPLINEAATMAFGSALSSVLSPGNIIFLEGNLGAGKTTCVRGILRGFGFTDAVKSPTYTLVEEYQFDWGVIYHFDLYRIKTAAELEFIGFRDYVSDNAIVLVEWAERGLGVLPKPDLELLFSMYSKSEYETQKEIEAETQTEIQIETQEKMQRQVTMRSQSQTGQKIAIETQRVLQKELMSTKSGKLE